MPIRSGTSLALCRRRRGPRLELLDRKPIRAGATLSFAVCVGLFPPSALGALSPFVVEELELARTAFGLLGTASFAVAALLSPVAGSLVDRYGGRATIMVLFGVGALAWLIFGLAPGYPLLLLAVLVAGVCMAFANPATTSVIAHHASPATLSRFVGVAQTGPPLAGLIAGLVLPAGAVALGWRSTVILFAGLVVIGVPSTASSIPRGGPVGREPSAAGVSEEPAVTARRPWILGTFALLINLSIVPVLVYVPLYAFERFRWSPTQAALLTGVVGVSSLFGRLAWSSGAPDATAVAGRLTALPLVAIGGMTAILAADPLEASWLLWVGVTVFGASATAWTALILLSVALGAGAGGGAGRDAGSVMLLGFVGGALGPVLFGSVVDATGTYGPAWGIGLATLSANTAVAMVNRRRVKRAAASRPIRSPG